MAVGLERLAERDRRQLEGEAAGLEDAALDVLHPLLEVRMALVDVRPGVEDRDHRLAGVVQPARSPSAGSASGARTPQVVHAEPAVAAQLFRFLPVHLEPRPRMTQTVPSCPHDSACPLTLDRDVGVLDDRAHFSRSATMNWANSSGVLPIGFAPMLLQLLLHRGLLHDPLHSRLILFDDLGRRAGGREQTVPRRRLEARAGSRPWAGRLASAAPAPGWSPPARAHCRPSPAGRRSGCCRRPGRRGPRPRPHHLPAALVGHVIMLAPVLAMNSSPARWIEVPTPEEAKV